MRASPGLVCDPCSAKPGASAPYAISDGRAVAGRLALEDAGLSYNDIEQAFAGYVFGDSTCGQKVLYRLGMSGLPVVNVNNNCSTGSSALFLARQAIQSGADCVLAIGFEQMSPGALGRVFLDRPDPLELFNAEAERATAGVDLPVAIRFFGGAGEEYMRRFGTKLETFARVRAKASRHAAHNPLALFPQGGQRRRRLAASPVALARES